MDSFFFRLVTETLPPPSFMIRVASVTFRNSCRAARGTHTQSCLFFPFFLMG